MASEAGDVPPPKQVKTDDVPPSGEKGKGVLKQGSSRRKGSKSSGGAASSSTGREKGNCET